MSKGGHRENAGRPKGSTNEIANRIRRKIIDAIDWESIPDDLAAVSPRERLRFIASILNKVLPRPVVEQVAENQNITFVIQEVGTGEPLKIDG